MAFPIVKDHQVSLDKCSTPKFVSLNLEVDAAALSEVENEINNAVQSALGAGTGGITDKISVLFTGDAANVTIPQIVKALGNAVKNIHARVSPNFYATKCCPDASACEIQRGGAAARPWTIYAVKIEAEWDPPIPGEVEACMCRGRDVGGGMFERTWGTHKRQVFTLNWVVTIAVDKLNLSYPFTAQIDTITVTSPCCCPPIPPDLPEEDPPRGPREDEKPRSQTRRSRKARR